MALRALLLAIAAFFCTGLGVVLTPIPWVGAVFAFGAPALAIAGIVVGGKAISAAKLKDPQYAGGGLPLAGVVTSAIALVPALLTALTCGTCNALCATGKVHRQGTYTFGTGTPQGTRPQPAVGADAGVRTVPPFPSQPSPAAPTGITPGDPAAAPAPAPAPAPALPPPPLAPGPSH